MIQQTLLDLWHGFEIALQPHNLMWAFFGVLVGNMVGVLPGLGALSAISILLPLTFVMHAVPALMMLAGIFYGCIYGGAIGAILLNLPTHPPHAVTCIDGYPMTKQGKGGTALGITMLASFFAASVGILVMIFSRSGFTDGSLMMRSFVGALPKRLRTFWRSRSRGFSDFSTRRA